MNNKSSEQDRSWSFYWRSGASESCLGGSGNYEGVIRDSWLKFFSQFNTHSLRALDVATGAGAIAKLALQTRLNTEYPTDILGIDAAEIPTLSAPAQSESEITLTMQGNTPVEHFQSENESFDLIVSQYGIEYSDWSKSIPLIANWLKEGGCGRFVCHTADSVVNQRVKQQRKQAQAVKDTQVFKQFASLLQLQQQGVSQSKWQASRAKFDRVVAKLHSQHKKQSNPLLADALNAIEVFGRELPQLGLDNTVKRTLAAHDALMQGLIRLKNFTDSLLTPKQLHQLCETLEANGLSITYCEPIMQDDNKIGIDVQFKK